MTYLRAFVVAVTLAAAPFSGPVAAEPNAQLVASVQNRLNVLGFQQVDADSLTTRQIAALHMELQGRALSFGSRWINTRQRVKVILGWDGFERRE